MSTRATTPTSRWRRARRRWRNLVHVGTHTDWDRIRGYLRGMRGDGRLPILRFVRLQWRHGASPDDALVLGLLGRTDCEVARHITRSRRHEFTLATSDPRAWPELADKWRFADRFRDLIGRMVLPAPEALALLRADPDVLGPEVVVKRRHGQSGAGQRFLMAHDAVAVLAAATQEEREDLVVEEVLAPHPALARLLPGVLHTLRVTTFLTGDEVEVWPVVLRVAGGVTGSDGAPIRIDSTGSGGFAVGVAGDGQLAALGRFRDPSAARPDRHPVTKTLLAEVRVPGMEQVRAVVRAAATRLPEVRSIGWDVAVTTRGPVLIEGNHNWGSILLELGDPDLRGRNHLLTRHVRDEVYGGGCRHCRRAARTAPTRGG